jgi:arginine repressor
MDIKKLFDDLRDRADLTEEQIAEHLRQRGAEITQPTVHRLRTGKILRARYDVVTALIALHKEKVGTARNRRTAA